VASFQPTLADATVVIGAHAKRGMEPDGRSWPALQTQFGAIESTRTHRHAPAAGADAAHITLCIGGGDPIDFIGTVRSLKGLRVVKVELPEAAK
jgi:hypothetical protein